MDNNLKWVNECRINRTIESLKKNNMNGYLAKDKEEIVTIIETIIKKEDVISCGGSMSLFEVGIIDYLREEQYNFLDRYEEGLSRDEIENIFRQSFFADSYITSTNAITEKGELYNVDGNGNRVAAMLYGPKKVIVIVGVNKIVKDLDEAIRRNREIAAPANAKRLNRKTPCAKVGHCMDCNSNDRICNEYTIIKRQGNKDRVHVIFLNEELGY